MTDFLQSIQLCCVDCGAMLRASRCPDCNRHYQPTQGIFSFLSREDQQSPLFQEYSDNYQTIAQDDLTESIIGNCYKKAQCDKMLKYCGKSIRGAVLDLGVGEGNFFTRIPHHHKVGVDIALPYLSALVEEGHSLVQANAQNLPFVNCFDLVVLSDVLEHVLNPEEVLRGIVRAAKPNAKVVIRVPYKEDLSPYTKEAGCPYKFVHLRSFDEDSLEKYLSDAELKLVRFHYDGWSMNRYRKTPQGWMQWVGSKAASYYYERLLDREPAADADRHFYRWPNWLGRLAFDPWEIVAVARV